MTVVTTQLATVISTVVSDRLSTVVSTRDVVSTAQGSTVFIVSTATSVLPASTATQTIRTTLPGSTIVVTNTAPGAISTTTLSGQVITTTSISIRPASTATYTTSVVSYVSYGQVACPASSGQEYTGADGERICESYLMNCTKSCSISRQPIRGTLRRRLLRYQRRRRQC